MKRPSAKDPKLAKVAQETGQDDATFWPGDALLKPGTINKKTIKIGDGVLTEETRLPEMLNDGKLNNDGSNAR
jgi:hypothetical protein